MTEPIIQRHMRLLVAQTLVDEHVILNELSRDYVADKLASFIDAQALEPSQGMPVLAWLYKDTIEANGTKRLNALQRLGDVSLFLSGVFTDYVKSTPSGLGYYVDMGIAAYDSVAKASSPINPVFNELSNKFVQLVLVLNALATKVMLSQQLPSDALFELYVRDSISPIVKRKMLGAGLHPTINVIGLS